MEGTGDESLTSYSFDLPEEFIAQRPVSSRDHSRLLVYDCARDRVTHTFFHQIYRYVPSGSTLIINDSKVFPCRLRGQKAGGGKVEIFFTFPS